MAFCYGSQHAFLASCIRPVIRDGWRESIMGKKSTSWCWDRIWMMDSNFSTSNKLDLKITSTWLLYVFGTFYRLDLHCLFVFLLIFLTKWLREIQNLCKWCVWSFIIHKNDDERVFSFRIMIRLQTLSSLVQTFGNILSSPSWEFHLLSYDFFLKNVF